MQMNMTMTINEVIRILQSYPLDSLVCAYEGEESGIVILDTDKNEIGFIPTVGAL